MRRAKTAVIMVAMAGGAVLTGCAQDPEVPTYSTEPTEYSELTYVLTEFEDKNNLNAESIAGHPDNPGSADGYMYTYDDPASDLDDIFPYAAESEHCASCDVTMESNDENGYCCTSQDVSLGLCTEVGTFFALPPSCQVGGGIGPNRSNPFPYFGSTMSFHIHGKTAGQGVGWGIYFADDKTENPKGKATRNLTEKGQEGISFWATGNTVVEVSLNMPELAPIDDGGLCNPDKGEKCFDFHRVRFELDGVWREYHASWDDFKQEGWGIPVALDPDRVINIQFKIPAPAAGAKEFDAWFDHVGFYGGDKWKFVEQLESGN